MTAATRPAAASPAERLRLTIDVAVLSVLTIFAVTMFSASDVQAMGVWGRLLLPARMLALLLVATLLMRRNGEGWRDVGLGRPWRLWATPLLAIGGYLTAYLLVGVMVALLFPILHLPRPGIGPLKHLAGNLGEYLYWMIPVTWVSAAFGEELLFRGFFFTRLLRILPASRTGVIAAVTLQGLLFGALHLYLGVSGALVAGLLGFVLATVYMIAGRNLWAPIILHGLVDSTTITIVFLGLAKV